MALRVGLVVLPTDSWRIARRQWQWAEDVGFSTVWTYDHLRWGGFPDGPWHAAIPTLAAAALATTTVRLGTLVMSPNFRHPVPLARELMTLDDLSDGRLDLGIGPGSGGPDAEVRGQAPWTTDERMKRFAEFLALLDGLLTGQTTTTSGQHYASKSFLTAPGCVQRPRLPFTVAAGGKRGMELATRFGQRWVTIGPTGAGPRTPADIMSAVRNQCRLLDETLDQANRPRSDLGRVALWTPTDPIIQSVGQFEEMAAPFEQLGFTELVLHHPDQTGPYGGRKEVFEAIAAGRR
jgi:alkanesulfonate monooxygenase SsuD/methylene tetrahydromethanopterin reductase-like flavin-dependent oxidoreductase (luciferase family)